MAKTLATSRILLMAIVLSVAPRAFAAGTSAVSPAPDVDAAARIPDEIRNVGITEHPGDSVAIGAEFVNERGESRSFSSYFNHGRPIVLQLGYFQCPMLCSLVSRGLIDSAKELGLKAGTDFDMLFVSIDPSETPSLAALKKQSTMEYYSKPDEESGFHYMVGKQAAIRSLTDAVGFRYQEMVDTQQFAHPAAVFVLTPDGKISRYLYGVKFQPQTLRLSLVEASAGKIGTTVDRILLLCLHYDSASQHYALAIGMMRAGGVMTILTLGGTMFWLFRREFRLRGRLSGRNRISGLSDDELNGEISKLN